MMPLWTVFPWTRGARARGALAASLYEPLSSEDRALLDDALARDPELRRDAGDLSRVRDAVVLESPEFTGNLFPALAARIESRRMARRAAFRRAALAGAVCVPVALSAVFVLPGYFAVSPGVAGKAGDAPSSSLAGDLQTARQMIQAQDFAGGMRLLNQALARNPGDTRAGEAQTLLADMEFVHFQRYPEAHAAYARLREEYPGAFMGSPASIERFNLLDEARPFGYSTLHALDVARSNPGAAFEQYERLVAQHPGSLLASVALGEMQTLAGGTISGGAESAILALERARDRCREPAAIAQFNLALGGLYCDSLHDEERARELFLQAASSGEPGLTNRARQALARMGN